MPGMNESPANRATAERIKVALTAHFPKETFGVSYVPRDDILEMDQHQIIRRRGFLGILLPMIFGEVLCQYCGGNDCYVQKDNLLPIVQTIVSAAKMHPNTIQTAPVW